MARTCEGNITGVILLQKNAAFPFLVVNSLNGHGIAIQGQYGKRETTAFM